ncbi:MAG: 4'-phosphopantetheinyl transferase superfamily protein [Bacteroidales bacterium]|nr:4'-phosphopantetheinyl transferase superfamily protein [Bacteroidales bacterium]
MEETEEQLRAMCDLTNEDNNLIERCAATKRRIELLSVRALLKAVGINQTIHYKDRKPYLYEGYISISHSANMAAIIYNHDFPVGIDIETIASRIRRIASRAFSDAELAAADDDLEKLTILWNCKECVFKLANDEGIDFREMIEVDMPSDFSYMDNFNNEKNNIHCSLSVVNYPLPIIHYPLSIINCTLKKTGQTRHFSLRAMKIEDNTVVWGEEICIM